MFNNKGQSLVLFIIILPILLFILVLVIDIGRVIVLKLELNNISELVLDYGLDNIMDENIVKELDELVKLNKDDIDRVKLYKDNNKIYIELSEKSDGILSSFVNISMFNVKSYYVGYIVDEEKRIESLGD